MALDFTKLNPASGSGSLLKPREIFSSLPSKDKKYGYLRDVQAEVLDAWFGRRDEHDLRLKMNTGGGKTLVGLLLLQSSLNENKGPVVYLAPTRYLVSQVIKEAKKLGLSVEEEPRNPAVMKGKAILVTTIHKLFNGKSQFGVGEEGSKIDIGTLVLDDAHACMRETESQFTISVDSSHPIYQPLFELFKRDLVEQSSSKVLDIEENEPYVVMEVPFWAWYDKISDVERILHKNRLDEKLKFEWPLIQNVLRQCKCTIRGNKIEITPKCLPVSVIESFTEAKRRVFMSATFADDSILVTDFDVDGDSLGDAIAPNSASDIGDRMILVPQAIDPSISDEDIKKLAARRAKYINVVVLVPSGFRADFWRDKAQRVVFADDLETTVNQLKSGHVGLVVVVNKYDGVDLPNDACRLLIIDDLPNIGREFDKQENTRLSGSSIEVAKTIQVLEQGMGRGVRSNDDYCAILLMGRTLINKLYNGQGDKFFTPITKAQFDLSESVGEQIADEGVKELDKTLDHILNQNADWVRVSKNAIAQIQYDVSLSDLSIAKARRTAFNQAVFGDYEKAIAAIQDMVTKNAAGDDGVLGWMKSELAEYTHPVNPSEAQKILKSAKKLNVRLLKPIKGIAYLKLSEPARNQASACLDFIKKNFSDSNQLALTINAIASDLVFRPETATKFEQAIKDTGLILGFGSQRPEDEYGEGPDNLWAVGSSKFFVIECKNGVIGKEVNKKDCNQLNGSVRWFENKYNASCSCQPMMVHPSNIFESASTPPKDAVVMTKLDEFRNAIIDCVVAISKLPGYGTENEVAALLSAHKLLPGEIVNAYTLKARKRK